MVIVKLFTFNVPFKCIYPTETLRLYGPVTKLTRLASKDYDVPGSKLTIRKGTFIMIPVYAIHTDPEIFPDPLKFDPERFSDENKKKRHPMAYLAFGEGPRNCVGLYFLQENYQLIHK